MEVKNHLKKNLNYYLAGLVFSLYFGGKAYLERPSGMLYNMKKSHIEEIVDFNNDGYDYADERDLYNLADRAENKPLRYSDLKRVERALKNYRNDPSD